jgi:hypothetical protein
MKAERAVGILRFVSILTRAAAIAAFLFRWLIYSAEYKKHQVRLYRAASVPRCS